MVGPKHIIIAAYCIHELTKAAWSSSTALRRLTDGLEDMLFTATSYDVGVIVGSIDRKRYPS